MQASSRTPGTHLTPGIAPAGRIVLTRSTGLVLLLALALGLVGRQASAQSPTASQYEIQAVYLFNFARFVRWPPTAESAPISICIVDDKRYTETLAKVVQGEAVDSHPVVARSIQGPQDEAACSIVFIGPAAKDRVDSLLAATAGKSILTVSDAPGFLDHGGMIQFVVVSNRVRFSVNLRPVGSSGLSLSSELLKVAVNVTGKPAGGGAL